MNLELKIAWAYLKSNRQNKTISLISFISMAGLILSIMSLITILSVMNGFQSELKNRILAAISHAYISNYEQNIPDNTPLLQTLLAHPEVSGVSPYVEGYALLSYYQNSSGAIIRGIDSQLEQTTSGLLSLVQYGTSTLFLDNQIIIGQGLANTLAVGIGDKISLLTPNVESSIIGILPRFKQFKVVGIFNSGEQEYNNSLALITLSSAQKLYQKKGSITALRLKFSDVFSADIISESLQKTLAENYYITHWMQQKSNLLYALNLEKNMIRLILFFIITIASFNLVAMMIMVVVDKKADIAILRTIGMTPSRIKLVFFYQSLLIGLLGISIGVILGVALSLYIDSIVANIELLFDFKLFPQNVFYLNHLPSELQLKDVLFTIILALVLTVISAYYPATKASQTDIASTLNYE